MRMIGLILITIGFLGGALVAVLDPETIAWTYFVPCLLVGIAGVVIVQVAIRREATDAGRTQANLRSLHTSLGELVRKADALAADKANIDVYDLPERIDRQFRADITTFVDARESIIHAHGMQPYAEIMSHFAAAERYLNRVWSCAADGYSTEAHTYIDRSHQQFREALARLESLGTPAAKREADDGAQASEPVTAL